MNDVLLDFLKFTLVKYKTSKWLDIQPFIPDIWILNLIFCRIYLAMLRKIPDFGLMNTALDIRPYIENNKVGYLALP